jgi:hypothetical protein
MLTAAPHEAPSGFSPASSSACVAASFAFALRPVREPVDLCGHTHMARMVELVGGQLFVNPGSVGVPAYDDSAPQSGILWGTRATRFVRGSRKKLPGVGGFVSQGSLPVRGSGTASPSFEP